MARDIDWQAVEVEYRAGVLTLTEICHRYDVPLSTLHNRATKAGWARDLTARAKAQADKYVKRALTRQYARGQAQDAIDEDMEKMLDPAIRGMAIGQAQVRLKYKEMADRAIEMAEGYFQELELQSLAPNEARDLAELVAMAIDQTSDDADASGIDVVNRRIEAFRKTLSLSNRADIFKKLVDALKVAMGLSMQAYGMTDNPDGDEKLNSSEIPDNEAARRVAFLLSKAVHNKQSH